MTPLVNPHPMVTRAKDGFRLPHDRLTLVAMASSSPPSAILTSVHATLADPNLRVAMEEEYGALMSNGIWELVPRTLGSNAVTGKWVFTHKFLPMGLSTAIRLAGFFGASLSAPGWTMMRLFSPVVKPTTVCTVLTLAASRA
jgi:hypothetical protein